VVRQRGEVTARGHVAAKSGKKNVNVFTTMQQWNIKLMERISERQHLTSNITNAVATPCRRHAISVIKITNGHAHRC